MRGLLPRGPALTRKTLLACFCNESGGNARLTQFECPSIPREEIDTTNVRNSSLSGNFIVGIAASWKRAIGTGKFEPIGFLKRDEGAALMRGNRMHVAVLERIRKSFEISDASIFASMVSRSRTRTAGRGVHLRIKNGDGLQWKAKTRPELEISQSAYPGFSTGC
jgi:hypothetical protein